MPPSDGSKRKRPATTEESTKRRRSSSNSDEADDPNTEILLMEQGILESRKNYNDIAVLLSTVDRFTSGSPEGILAAVALCRIFVRLLAQGALVAKKGLSDKELVIVNWLKDQFAEYKTKLLAILKDEDVGTTGLTLCMRTLKAEGEFFYDKEDYTFPRAFLRGIMSTLFLRDDEDLVEAYVEEYVEQYDDIRYYTFNSVK